MGSAGWDLYLVSDGLTGYNRLDSRFRGNDGGLLERGRPARGAALARALAFPINGLQGQICCAGVKTRASARDTLILAFSHEGRRDPLAGIRTWFRMADLAISAWIPAFAGITDAKTNSKTYPCKPIKGEGIRWLGFVLDFGWLAWLQPSGFPLSRE